METQKIVNLSNDSDDEFSKLQQENGALLMVKEMKMIQLLSLKQKLLIQIFVIIQMHIFL